MQHKYSTILLVPSTYYLLYKDLLPPFNSTTNFQHDLSALPSQINNKTLI